MSHTRPVGATPISNSALIAHAGVLLAGVVVVQTYIAVAADQRVTPISTALLGVVAAYYYVFHARRTKTMRIRAYSRYFAHVTGFLIVNGSYWIHAAAITADGDRLDPSWWGPLYGMSIFWGLGLLIHTFGVLLSSGYDDVRI